LIYGVNIRKNPFLSAISDCGLLLSQGVASIMDKNHKIWGK